MAASPTSIPAARATIPFFSDRTYRDYLTPGETVRYVVEIKDWDWDFTLLGGEQHISPG